MVGHFRRDGRTIVLATHDLERGLSLCDDYAILNRGRIVSRGPTRDMTPADLETLYEESTQAAQPSVP